MKEISIDDIRSWIREEDKYIRKLEQVRLEMEEYGYYKSCSNDLERIHWEMSCMPQYIGYPNNKVKLVQPTTLYLYRGESKIYPSSKTSWARCIPLKCEDKPIYSFVECLRMSELTLFFKSLTAVACWKINEFNFYAVAQHYGFKTQLMDVTNRLLIALFFSCCTTDDDNHWRPLNKRDFRVDGLIDGNYGVLYFSNRFGLNSDMIQPVGYQPLLRCHLQYGYVIQMKNEWDLRDSGSDFTCNYFKHNEKFCEEIFNFFDGGEKIFPLKTDSIFLPFIERIRKTKTFSNKSFDVVYDHKDELAFPFPKKFSYREIKNILNQKGYKISNKNIVSEKEIDMTNIKWCKTCGNLECKGISVEKLCPPNS